jgi:hypothetical protein
VVSHNKQVVANLKDTYVITEYIYYIKCRRAKIYVFLQLLELKDLQGRNTYHLFVNISDSIQHNMKTSTRLADKNPVFVSLIDVNYKYLLCSFTDFRHCLYNYPSSNILT